MEIFLSRDHSLKLVNMQPDKFKGVYLQALNNEIYNNSGKDWNLLVTSNLSERKRNGYNIIYSAKRKTALMVRQEVSLIVWNDLHYVTELINDIDTKFFTKTIETTDSNIYTYIVKYEFDDLRDKYVFEYQAPNYYILGLKNQDKYQSQKLLNAKIIAKHNAKNKVKRKFKIGAHYYLRSRVADGSKQIVKEFVCKKFIYTVNDSELNSVIMKQVNGEVSNRFTLSRHECEAYHIKFEHGLQVFSMLLNWIPKNENYN